jgi:glutathione synthase/RimK-type ligase-like ATP-grasp enzyme
MQTHQLTKELVVIVDNINDWKPYHPTEQVIAAKDYLFADQFLQKTHYHVINLCSNMKYLSMGYYCSLIGEARHHKIFPSIVTINDLSKKKFYQIDLEDLTELINQKILKQNTKEEYHFSIFFGICNDSRFEKLSKKIFSLYPAPILDIVINYKDHWQVHSIKTGSLKNLTDTDQTNFANALDRFSSKIWRNPKHKKLYKYDLAILVDPKEQLPPSNKKALELFEKACEKKSVYCEFITKKNIGRVAEFDGLFIRETTAINNHTYHFAKLAVDEGLVVVDDPISMLRCTNKIYLENLLSHHKIQTIPSVFVSNYKEKTLIELEKKLDYPMVLKVPDGAFSKGVKKVKSRAELINQLTLMLEDTSLVLVQKFLYTDYDWRVGILNNEVLFVCRYFMSKGHWQIYNHDKKQKDKNFSGDAETLPIDQAPKKVLESALKSTKLIGNGLYGVDLKQAGEDVYIIEINDNPNIDHGVEDLVDNHKVYEKVIDFFIQQIEKKRKIKT